jgi:hypothetical protein
MLLTHKQQDMALAGLTANAAVPQAECVLAINPVSISLSLSLSRKAKLLIPKTKPIIISNMTTSINTTLAAAGTTAAAIAVHGLCVLPASTPTV